MRRLVIVPIVHGEEDSGSLKQDVAHAFQRRLGRRRWEAHKRAIRAFWDRVGERLDARVPTLDPACTRVYQDGLPVCGREAEMVRELAAQGSQNHQIVQRLIDAGAQVVGTEDPALLLEEYARIKRQLASRRRPAVRARGGAQAITSSLEPRDRFIADRIAQTLQDGQTGVLFIGLMHDVRPHLPDDIEVEYLMKTDEVLRMTAS